MTAVGVVVTLVASLVAVTFALANPALVAGFEVDAQIQRQSAAGEDWADGPGGQGVINDAGGTRAAICAANTGTNPLLVCDDVKSDTTTFPGGAKESDPSGWIPLQTSQVTPKTDITNVYAYGKPNSGSPTLLNGMERLPKAGDLHLDFEYNKLMTGTGVNQIPVRQENDILIAYDLGGARNSNSDAITVRVFKAKKVDPLCTSNCAGEYDYAAPDTEVSGTGNVSEDGVTAQVNGSQISCGAWQCYDDGGNLVNTLPAFSFAEAGIDLNTSVGLSSACFNFVTVKSRSSESVTSQLKDTTGPKSFPFCGGLAVHKYIDADNDGVKDAGEADGSGWSFTVNGPAAGGGIGPLVCSGTTGTNGNLSCTTGSLSELQPGTYRITETQKTGFYNSDPGDTTAGAAYPTVNKAATVSKDVTIGAGGTTTVEFGNACYTDLTFSISNIPASVTSVSVVYSATGPGAVSNVTLPLTINTTTRVASGTVNDTFTPLDTVTWSWYVNGDSAHSLTGATTPVLSGCSTTRSAAFTLTTLNGYKYKDANNSGNYEAASDFDGEGFTFDLRDSTNTVIATTTSSATGTYSFSNVAPGTYTVTERSETGWVQTEPSSGGRSVTVNLGDATKSIDDFGNTPLSNISVSFTPQAVTPGTTNPATEATISCANATPATVGGPQSGNSYSANNLRVGTYTCTVVIVDP